MKKMTIALLSGGASSEREVSINSGKQVFEALDKNKYDIIQYDPKFDLPRLIADASKIDAALVILHGPFGEDGTIQGFLDLLKIPYQGSGVLGSAAAMNKLAAKKLYEKAGLLVPPYLPLNRFSDIDVEDYRDRIGLPAVVKPVEGGSSIGMSIVFDEEELSKAVKKALEYDSSVFIEKYIKGVEITGGILGNEHPESLPLIEILPGKDHVFFDFEAKYQPGASEEICPARISEKLTKEAKKCAVTAHQALFCKGYSRTDMILDENNQIFVLETNTIPGMTPTSLFPQAANAYGLTFSQLLDRLIELGIYERGNTGAAK